MGFKRKTIRQTGKVKITSETVEKPRDVLAVKKTAFENAPGSTFSNRAL
jgi:hypothetical protein